MRWQRVAVGRPHRATAWSRMLWIPPEYGMSLTTDRATLSALLRSRSRVQEKAGWRFEGGRDGEGIVRSYFAFLGIATLHYDLVEHPFSYDK